LSFKPIGSETAGANRGKPAICLQWLSIVFEARMAIGKRRGVALMMTVRRNSKHPKLAGQNLRRRIAARQSKSFSFGVHRNFTPSDR
jgi:hypothetical protein